VLENSTSHVKGGGGSLGYPILAYDIDSTCFELDSTRFDLNDSSVFFTTDIVCTIAHQGVENIQDSRPKDEHYGPINSIELQPPPPHHPLHKSEKLLIRIFVSLLCDFTQLLQDLEQGVRSREQRSRRRQTEPAGREILP